MSNLLENLWKHTEINCRTGDAREDARRGFMFGAAMCLGLVAASLSRGELGAMMLALSEETGAFVDGIPGGPRCGCDRCLAGQPCRPASPAICGHKRSIN